MVVPDRLGPKSHYALRQRHFTRLPPREQRFGPCRQPNVRGIATGARTLVLPTPPCAIADTPPHKAANYISEQISQHEHHSVS